MQIIKLMLERIICGKIKLFLSFLVRGLGLSTGSSIRTVFRFRATSKLRSSMYFKLSAYCLGMDGLRAAPLKMIMKSKMPRKAP